MQGKQLLIKTTELFPMYNLVSSNNREKFSNLFPISINMENNFK